MKGFETLPATKKGTLEMTAQSHKHDEQQDGWWPRPPEGGSQQSLFEAPGCVLLWGKVGGVWLGGGGWGGGFRLRLTGEFLRPLLRRTEQRFRRTAGSKKNVVGRTAIMPGAIGIWGGKAGHKGHGPETGKSGVCAWPNAKKKTPQEKNKKGSTRHRRKSIGTESKKAPQKKKQTRAAAARMQLGETTNGGFQK